MPRIGRGSNMHGLAILGLAFFVFASSDTIAKFLTDQLHPIQIVWFRQWGLMSGAIILLMIKGVTLLRSAHPKLQILRGSLAVFSAVFFVFAVSHVPLADAVAVTFVAPFMVTIMGIVFLKEKVGIRRWAAIVLGFIGTLIIIRPGAGVFHPAIFLVLAAALFFAMRQVLSRAVAASDQVATTIVYTAIVSVSLLTIPLPFVWQWPASGTTWLLLLGLALLAACGEILVIKAFEMAEAAIIAPMHYTLIIWASFYGWLIFGQLPDFWTWVGTAIICATGIYVLNRERILAQQRRLGANSD